jgi:hypothetical protein
VPRGPFAPHSYPAHVIAHTDKQATTVDRDPTGDDSKFGVGADQPAEEARRPRTLRLTTAWQSCNRDEVSTCQADSCALCLRGHLLAHRAPRSVPVPSQWNLAERFSQRGQWISEPRRSPQQDAHTPRCTRPGNPPGQTYIARVYKTDDCGTAEAIPQPSTLQRGERGDSIRFCGQGRASTRAGQRSRGWCDPGRADSQSWQRPRGSGGARESFPSPGHCEAQT